MLVGERPDIRRDFGTGASPHARPLEETTAMDASDPNESGSNDDSDEQRSPWVVAGVFGALGFEFVGFTIGGYIVGRIVDDHFATEPFGVIIGIALGLIGVFWHIYRVSKRFIE